MSAARNAAGGSTSMALSPPLDQLTHVVGDPFLARFGAAGRGVCRETDPAAAPREPAKGSVPAPIGGDKPCA